MALSCRSMLFEAHRILYRSISLSDTQIPLLYRTISTSSFHASLIRRLEFIGSEQLDIFILETLAHTLNILPRLKYLAIRRKSGRPTYQHQYGYYRTLLAFRSSRLCGFSTNLFLQSSPQVMEFLSAHPRITVLNLEGRRNFPASQSGSLFLPSLRTLSCSSTFLRTLTEPSMQNVVRLHLREYTLDDLTQLGLLSGSRLRALRLGVLEKRDDERTAWSVGEFAGRFPGLELLQMNMENQHGPLATTYSRPYRMMNWPIDFRRGSPYTEPSSRRFRAPLAIIWSYPHLHDVADVVTRSAADWILFLDGRAFEVLKASSSYLDRIVYSLPPTYVSAKLGPDQSYLVSTRYVEMAILDDFTD
ncbi:hypothetical protein BV20DRAFT_973050 [Pilatotrama ljubarskyi]|nr:hypothetical protein BV20DRAFT_973050 [Pilatotrama ljubarskyi]